MNVGNNPSIPNIINNSPVPGQDVKSKKSNETLKTVMNIALRALESLGLLFANILTVGLINFIPSVRQEYSRILEALHIISPKRNQTNITQVTEEPKGQNPIPQKEVDPVETTNKDTIPTGNPVPGDDSAKETKKDPIPLNDTGLKEDAIPEENPPQEPNPVLEKKPEPENPIPAEAPPKEPNPVPEKKSDPENPIPPEDLAKKPEEEPVLEDLKKDPVPKSDPEPIDTVHSDVTPQATSLISNLWGRLWGTSQPTEPSANNPSFPKEEENSYVPPNVYDMNTFV